MTISGIGASYSYGSYANRIDASNTDAEVNESSQVSQSAPLESSASHDDQEQHHKQEAIKTTSPQSYEKFIFDFKKDNEYNLIGAKSKLEDMDVDKALSDMKKDSVLDQYKFFVKSTLVSNEDGSVRQVTKR